MEIYKQYRKLIIAILIVIWGMTTIINKYELVNPVMNIVLLNMQVFLLLAFLVYEIKYKNEERKKDIKHKEDLKNTKQPWE